MNDVDHFEALFNRNYLRWFHLGGKPALCEIISVDRDVELTLPGGAKAKKPVVHLTQIQGTIEEMRPLVLNVTNGRSIAAVHGNKPSEWPGKQIVLMQSETEMFDRDLKKMITVNCIRIRAPKPKESK